MNIKSNIYKIAFPFEGEYLFLDINSNQIANKALSNIFGDSVFTLHDYDKKQYLCDEFEKNGEKYIVDFSYDDAESLNVYIKQDEDESLVAKNIPYLVLSVTDGEDILYKLSDHI